MENNDRSLGSLIAVHNIEPAFLQRAVFIVVLSFMFFLAMMFAFYIRQSFGYFLLASAFLVIYLFTMFSWIVQRRSGVKIYENGISYKNRTAFWDEVESIENSEIKLSIGKPMQIPNTIQNAEVLTELIRKNIT